MTDDGPHSIALNISGPPDPHYVLELAEGLAEVVRIMNHLTRDHAALADPSDVHQVILSLSSMAGRLPQLLSQVSGWLDREGAAGRIEVPSGEHQGNPLLAVATAALRLDAASVAAAGLQEALDAVARVTSDLAAREDGTDE